MNESTPLIFKSLPHFGAWQLQGAYDGFEIAHFTKSNQGIVITGVSIGIEDGSPWELQYKVELDRSWRTRKGFITTNDGNYIKVEADGQGHFEINGKHDPLFDGCLDLDFEFSAVTNTVPVHRLALGVGQHANAPAVYVRTKGLHAEQLQQVYRRLPNKNGSIIFDYTSPRFGYHDQLQFASDGLVINYPGIATRVH